LEGASPLSVFDAVEAPALISLPTGRFELATWSSPKVGPDCHIKVGRALYSVPWRHIGARVDARETDRVVEVFVGTALIKTHARAEKGEQTDWDDHPPEKVAFFMRTPTWCRNKAAELGAHVCRIVEDLLADSALHHLRAAQGIIGLADKHPAERLDAACARAIEVGDPTYRTVKGVLAAGTEHDGEAPAGAPAAPAHLHGPTSLFDGLADTGLADTEEVAG